MRALPLALLLLGAAAGPAAAQHGDMFDDMDCSDCHTPDGWKVSTAAGPRSGFDHARTGFPLAGAHRTTSCGACHTGTAPLQRECAGCHDDPHQARLGPACAECHTAVDWLDTRTLDRHRRTRMPLTGRHALLECSACHRRQGERTWSDVPSDCFGCHQKDYHGDLHPDHDGDPADPSVQPLPRDCGQCHRTTGWTPAVIVPGSLARLALGGPAAPANHDLRFALSFGPHRGAPCESCHAGPRRVECTGCHAHGEVALARQHRRLAIGRSAAGCLRCHPGGTSR